MIDTNKALELAQEIKAIGDSGMVKPVQEAAALLLALAEAHDAMAMALVAAQKLIGEGEVDADAWISDHAKALKDAAMGADRG